MSQIVRKDFMDELNDSFYLLQQTIYKRNISHEEVYQVFMPKILSNKEDIDNYIKQQSSDLKSTKLSVIDSIDNVIKNETSTAPLKNIARLLDSANNDKDQHLELAEYINNLIIKLSENFTPDNKLDIIDPILINHALIILEITNSFLIEITKHRVIGKRKDPIKEQQAVVAMNVARRKQDQARSKKTPEFEGVADVVKYIDKNYIKWQKKFTADPKCHLIPRHFKTWFKNQPDISLSEYYKENSKTTRNAYINEQTRHKIK